MSRPRKTPLNGDSKLIYDAIANLQKDVTLISNSVSSEVATRNEQHASNLRVQETMAGDLHIVLSKVQNLPCGAINEKVTANEKSIDKLWKFTIGGILLIVVGAAVKIWLL